MRRDGWTRRAILFGLLLAAPVLSACLGEGGPATRTIVVDIEHSRFEPARLQVEAGERVRFLIRNGDPIPHEFIIGDEQVQDAHEEGTEAHHGAKPGEVSVPAAGEAETTFTFTEPGTLVYGCHLPSHYDYGMRGRIDIR